MTPHRARWSWLSALLAAMLGCSGTLPPAAPRPRAADAVQGEDADREHPPAAPRPLETLADLRPRTRLQLHLVHVAQIELALREPANDFDESAFRELFDALGEALANASPDDLVLARQLLEAATALAEPIRAAMASAGIVGIHRDPARALTPAPDEMTGSSIPELLALIDTGGSVGEAAAFALRTRVQQADTGTPGALASVLEPADFGHLVEHAGPNGVDMSLALQLLSSAHNEPDWVDWLGEHPDRIAPSLREMAGMLLEQDDRPSAAARNRAALALLRAAGSTLPPAGRRFSMPDDNPATLAAAWRLAAAATEIGPLAGVFGELMRRSVTDPAQQALAARHDGDIATALGRCEELVRQRPSATWVERVLQDATAGACSSVTLLAANTYTPRLRRALLAALDDGPDPWVREVYGALTLARHEADVPAATMDAVLARPSVRERLLVRVTTEALWSRLPAADKTDDAVLAMVARIHAATLLGAPPDRVSAPAPTADVPDVERAVAVTVSSSETPDLPPIRLLLGILPHRRALRPIDVARFTR